MVVLETSGAFKFIIPFELTGTKSFLKELCFFPFLRGTSVSFDGTDPSSTRQSRENTQASPVIQSTFSSPNEFHGFLVTQHSQLRNPPSVSLHALPPGLSV